MLRTPTSQLSDRVAGPDYVVPRLHQWNLSTQFRLLRGLTFDIGYVGSQGSRLLLARGLNQPLLASAGSPVNCGYDGVAGDCITTNTAQNAGLRVPIMGETPTALAANEFSGASAYHSLQVTLRKQSAHGLAFQTTYTYSRAATNTVIYNDPNNLALDWARSSFDRTHRFTANFDYQLPARLKGWTLAGIVIVQSGLPMTLTDPNGGGVYGARRNSHRHPVSRCDICGPGHRGQHRRSPEPLDRHHRHLCAGRHRVRRIDCLWQRRAEHHARSRPVQYGFLSG